MTRPKVDPDKRQRTAQACDSCKRRKQKCNGLKPCQTCSKRNLPCTYGSPDQENEDQPSPKRRMIDPSSIEVAPASDSQNSPVVRHAGQSVQWASDNVPVLNGTSVDPASTNTPGNTVVPLSDGKEYKPNLDVEKEEPVLISGGDSTVSGQDEEAVVYSNSRMLQDPSGRLLYIGDSATLSFLQLIRMIVDNVAGQSPFTNDPRRHRIVEATVNLPKDLRRTHLLPDKQTAIVLVDSYFTNINGLLEICHRKSFMTSLDNCYSNPLSVDPSWLCQLYLMFAIGLVMAAPSPGTQEDAIIQRLRSEPVDRAEVFYSDAKLLADPSSGFEDAGFWSIQALTLMSVYTLAVSRRNAAYAYYGMAVRSAFALGLHRDETMCIFSSAEQSIRRNLWRSLFVLDRFLAASLGRPTAIRESDCSGTTLHTGEKAPFPQAPFPTAANASYTSPSALGLEASVRSCHVIGVVLEKVYSHRKISTRLAQEIADNCKGWPKALDPSLHHRQATSTNPSQGIAILHVNLLYCHSIILLTRPFFLFLMNKVHQERAQPGSRPERTGTRMEKFAEACVIASSHSISLVQNALDGRYLPHRNPFVLYFLFASALVILSNEFSALYHNPSANTSINNSVNIMRYFAQRDPQGSRLLFILTSFRDVVIRQQTARSQQLSADQHTGFVQPSAMADDTDLSGLFPGSGTFTPSKTPIPTVAEPNLGRHNSNPNISPTIPFANTPRMSANLFQTDPMSSSRHNSLDTFFDLARVSSHSAGSNDGNESLGDAEIDFETLWQWPASLVQNTTPGAPSQSGMGNLVDVQGVSDSTVPLFGMARSDFMGT